MASKILWTDQTWNPVIGCSKVSPGCEHCYAERMACRLTPAMTGNDNYQRIITGRKWNGSTVFVESALEKPLHWKKPRMIFVCSMGDLFHESVPFSWIEKVMSVIEECPQHTFQVLTKRPHIMAEYFNGLGKVFELFCLQNLWLGVTAENQEMADERIPVLLKIPVAKRFVSVEPMLGSVKIWERLPNGAMLCPGPIANGRGLDWIICGGESGPGARLCQNNWVSSLVTQCKSAGVPVFVKQLHLNAKPKAIKDITQFPPDLRVREIPNVSR